MADPLGFFRDAADTVGDFVPDVIKGRGMGADALREGRPLDAVKGMVSDGISLGADFSILGDGLAAYSLGSGRDPVSGQELPDALRYAGLLGVGIPAAAVTAAVIPASTLLAMQAQRANRVWERSFQLGRIPGLGAPEVEVMFPAPGSAVVPGRQTEMFAGLTQPSRVLEAGPQALTEIDMSLPSMLDSTRSIVNGVDMLDDGGVSTAGLVRWLGTAEEDVEKVNGFLFSLGNELIDTPLFREHGVPDELFASYSVASAALAKFNFASETELLKGKYYEGGDRLWKKLKGGNALSVSESARLQEVVTDFNLAMQWADHPEFADLNPLLRISEVTKDKRGQRVKVALGRLAFDPVPEGQLSSVDLNKRLNQMALHNPTALLHILSNNLVKFFEDFVQEDVITFHRGWYKQAYEEAYELAELEGLSRAADEPAEALLGNVKRFVVVAALTSGEQGWDVNLPIAASVWKAVRDLGADPTVTFADIVQKLQTDGQSLWGKKAREMANKSGHDYTKDGGQTGVKVSEDDVLRSLIAFHTDDWEDYLRPVSAAETMDLKEIRSALDPTATGGSELVQRKRAEWAGRSLSEIGPELNSLRKLAPSHQALKQPSFAYGIINSEAEEQIAVRSQVLMHLLAGRLNPEDFGLEGLITNRVVPGEDLRGLLPVVVDRHAYGVPLGFTILPDSQLSGSKGLYDVFAQAYRQASATISYLDEFREMGPRLGGRALTPEELQAVTWQEWRRLTGVVDPAIGPEFRIAAPTVKMVANFGAQYKYDSMLYRLLHGLPSGVLPAPGVLASKRTTFGPLEQLTARQQTKRLKPTELTVQVELDEDGMPVLYAPANADTLSSQGLRTLYPTNVGRAGFAASKVVEWRPKHPRQVASIARERTAIERAETVEALNAEGTARESGTPTLVSGPAAGWGEGHPANQTGTFMVLRHSSPETLHGVKGFVEGLGASVQAEVVPGGKVQYSGSEVPIGDLGDPLKFEPLDAAEYAKLSLKSDSPTMPWIGGSELQGRIERRIAAGDDLATARRDVVSDAADETKEALGVSKVKGVEMAERALRNNLPGLSGTDLTFYRLRSGQTTVAGFALLRQSGETVLLNPFMSDASFSDATLHEAIRRGATGMVKQEIPDPYSGSWMTGPDESSARFRFAADAGAETFRLPEPGPSYELRVQVTNPTDMPTIVNGLFNGDRSIAKDVLRNGVVDLTLYTDSGQNVPVGFVPVFEHHYTDGNGYLIHLARQGDERTPHTHLVFVPAQMRDQLPARSARHSAGTSAVAGKDPGLNPNVGTELSITEAIDTPVLELMGENSALWDNKIRLVAAPGETFNIVSAGNRTRQKLFERGGIIVETPDGKVGYDQLKQGVPVLVSLPNTPGMSLPVVVVGDHPEVLTAATRGGPPQTVVELTITSRSSSLGPPTSNDSKDVWAVRLPFNANGEVNQTVAAQIPQLLRDMRSTIRYGFVDADGDFVTPTDVG